jgi:amino acid adenylation domain-containing protein
MQEKILEGFQLSPQQEYLWALQREGALNASWAQWAIMIEGSLDKKTLKAALQLLGDRHEILRTTFHRPHGVGIPFQVINEEWAPLWHETDLSSAAEGEQVERLEQALAAQAHESFDYENGPLVRASLIALSANRQVLLLTLPTLCADARTLRNLCQQVGRAYAASMEGGGRLDDAMQYADFAMWQQELLESDEAEEAAAYWRQQQASRPLKIEKLPLPQTTPATVFARAAVSLVVHTAEVVRLEAAANMHNVSPSDWLFACWQVLMWRLTEEAEFVIGNVLDGRSHEELHESLGPFARTLPVRCRFEADFRFSDILKQVKQATGEAARWQDYFVAPAVHRGSEDALLPVVFAYETVAEKFAAAGVVFSVVKQEVCTGDFKLKLVCQRAGEVFEARLHYDAKLLAVEDVARLGEEFAQLVASTLDDPKAKIDQLEILGAAERQRLLESLNDTAVRFPDARCFHEVFEEQAARTPGAVAVIFEDEQLTFGELNARANQLAHRLRKMGVGPERPVATWLERSSEMLVAMLGTMKAGGTYMPLDLGQPKTRLSLTIEEVAPLAVLTRRHVTEQIPGSPTQVLYLDDESLATESTENLAPVATPENLAYVIFTSGSTGTPKGVGVEHRQLFNYLNAILQRLNLPPGASYASVSTFAADLGHTVVFPALATGGCLHVIPHELVADGQQLGEYFSRHAIDCLKIVPSHLAALLACPQPEQLLPQKRLVLGGEASRSDWVARLQSLAPACTIFNHYGPTEATVGVLTHQAGAAENDAATATLPLGRPLANVQIYLLDSHLQPVPFGAPGELCIGGANVARGYLNRPRQTAERFVPDAFAQVPGARLYRTGDRARYLPDGALEFLGRLDRQVKIRGYRIELGEIEVLLERHGAVRQAVVVLNDDEPGEKRLVAYLVPVQQRFHAPANELRQYLLQRLPDYSVPTMFVWLDVLPLTSNGKLDFQALPPPERLMHELNQTFVAPRNAVEEVLAQMWMEVLKLDRVGVYDDFFELGGHSLLVMQIIARLRDTFQAELPATALFDATTIADLTEILVAHEEQPGQTEKIAAIIQKLNRMSDEDARATLDAKRRAADETSEGPRGDEA